MSDPIIWCQHVTVAYGSDVVLRDICLDVEEGIFLPFVGPNGAGKTTLLRAILGLLKIRSGEITTPFDRSPPGYVPQQHAIDTLYPVSVRQIVEMGLYPKLGWWRRPARCDHDRVDSALERFGLFGHQRKTFSELSEGMKQKALIARALVSGADVLIMDEPTSELDEASEVESLHHLSRLSHEEGKTVLLAYHGVEHMIGLAESVCLVDHGRACVKNLERHCAERPNTGMRNGQEEHHHA